MKSASKAAFLVSCVLTFLHLQLLFKIICLVGIFILGVTQVRKKPNLWFPYTGLFLINLILS